MKLLTKFNLILICFFGVCGFVIADVAYNFLISNARREVLQEAELMMTNAKSVRDYTADEMAPLLEQSAKHDSTFLPETSRPSARWPRSITFTRSIRTTNITRPR